jgi:site-specific recombinase XerD
LSFVNDTPTPEQAQQNRDGWLAAWSRALSSEPSLAPRLREAYRRAIAEFLSYCRRKDCSPSVAAARAYVEVARLEQAPGPVQLQAWKEALNWFFRQQKQWVGAQAREAQGVPALGRQDLGRAEWERGLIERVRTLHLAWRTERTYRGWNWRLAKFLHPKPMEALSGEDVRLFLTHLAVELRVGVATRRQALNAAVFFLREVQGKEPGDFSDFTRARPQVRVPVVLSRSECERLFEAMEGVPRLMAEVMYGGGCG